VTNLFITGVDVVTDSGELSVASLQRTQDDNVILSMVNPSVTFT
jgi:hypothetical protein